MSEIETALSNIETFKPDWFNYWQMGNGLHHLHYHGIPRYKDSREFNGKKWVDTTWGSIPVWSRTDVEHTLVAKIRDAIKPCLPR